MIKGKFTINPKRVLYDIFEYLIALVMIMEGRGIYCYLSISSSWISYLLLMLLLIASFGCIALKSRRNVKKRGIILSLILACYFFAFSLVRFFNAIALYMFILAVFTIVLFYYSAAKDDGLPTLLVKYKNLMIFIAIISLFFWVFGSILNFIKPTGIEYTSWTRTGKLMPIDTFYHLYFEIPTQYITWGSNRIMRNCAIFTEPPMASLHFCVALMIELLLCKKKSKSHILILTLAILSTTSSMGFIVLVICLTWKYIYGQPKDRIIRLFKIFILPIIFIVGFLAVYEIIMKKLGTASGNIRLDDFVVGYKAWKSNLLLGAGYGNLKYIQSFMGSWRSNNIGFSNSLMQILAQGGIYFVLPYIFAFTCGIKKTINFKNWNSLIFIILILIMFIFTIVSYQYIIIYLLIYFYDMKFSLEGGQNNLYENPKIPEN